MTDFLDRIVARVLPAPEGGGVRTPPRSRFEEPSMGAAPDGHPEDEAMWRYGLPDEEPGSPGLRDGADERAGRMDGMGRGGPTPARPHTAQARASGGEVAGERGRDGGGSSPAHGRPGDAPSASLRRTDREGGRHAPGVERGASNGADHVAAPGAGPASGPTLRTGRQSPPPATSPSMSGVEEATPGRRSAGEASAPREAHLLRLRLPARPGGDGDGSFETFGFRKGDGRSAGRGDADEPGPPGPRRQPTLRPSAGTVPGPTADSGPPPIQLRIGRIEIRGEPPAPAPRRVPVPPPQPRLPAVDLAEYLRRRNTGRRP